MEGGSLLCVCVCVCVLGLQGLKVGAANWLLPLLACASARVSCWWKRGAWTD